MSVFISDIGLQFSFCVCVVSLSGFGIKMMVASENEFGNVLPPKCFGRVSGE